MGGAPAWNRKTNEQFLEELKEKNIKYIPLEKYRTVNDKIKFMCPKCGGVWEAKPGNILSGKGCVYCKRQMLKKINQKTHKQFLEEVAEKNPNIEILGVYQEDRIPIMVACKKHGNRAFLQTPSVTLRGCGCDICMKEKISLKNRSTVEYFLEQCKKNSPQFEIIEPQKYKNARTKMKARCKVHQNVFDALAEHLADGKASCPVCAMSNGEHIVSLFLDKNNYTYMTQYTPEDGGIGRRRFDFYLPEVNTVIEYDGAQHFIPVKHWGGEKALEKQIAIDAEKDKYCKKVGLRMIRVPYTEKNVDGFLRAAGL